MKTKSLVLAVAACTLLSVALCGCALFKSGPKPEELVMQQTQAFTNDFTAGNADKILDYVSETFTNEHVASKADIAKQIDKAKQNGKLDQAKQFIKDHEGKIDLKEAKVTVKKGKASVYPIHASADMGEVTIRLDFNKDPDKAWRICGIDIEGI